MKNSLNKDISFPEYGKTQESEYSVEQFKSEINSTFDLRFLEKARIPFDLGEWKFDSFPSDRVNNYLIKSNDEEDYNYGEIVDDRIKGFVDSIRDYMINMGISPQGRYCYLTIDQGSIETGKTLRTPGWHIDGLQGNEVPEKKPADFQYIWTDVLPTDFADQGFDMTGIDVSVDNVFTRLEEQIKSEQVIPSKAEHIYLMNPYHVHAAKRAKEDVYRRFIRVTYSHIPVTSVKMSVNPAMNYNYPIQSTPGEIPECLK